MTFYNQCNTITTTSPSPLLPLPSPSPLLPLPSPSLLFIPPPPSSPHLDILLLEEVALEGLVHHEVHGGVAGEEERGGRAAPQRAHALLPQDRTQRICNGTAGDG
jgi:hypothetical protein